ncbi:MAG: hypothetical protein HFH91_08685 [Lachnospiraceae bacterium]|nr:hypothetical protein [Lachnospiraceae bacterium]
MKIVIFSDAMVFFSSLTVSAPNISENAAIFYSDRTGITDSSYHSPSQCNAECRTKQPGENRQSTVSLLYRKAGSIKMEKKHILHAEFSAAARLPP